MQWLSDKGSVLSTTQQSVFAALCAIPIANFGGSCTTTRGGVTSCQDYVGKQFVSRQVKGDCVASSGRYSDGSCLKANPRLVMKAHVILGDQGSEIQVTHYHSRTVADVDVQAMGSRLQRCSDWNEASANIVQGLWNLLARWLK